MAERNQSRIKKGREREAIETTIRKVRHQNLRNYGI